MTDAENLLSRLDIESASILEGAEVVERRLHDLEGCFADETAYQKALAKNDPLVYRVSGVQPADGPGDLHYGLGMIAPGQIGSEYYLTKGHLHLRREAAEIYVGLSGTGMMLLEDEHSGQGRIVLLANNTVVYVPGHTAHRTMNTGQEPLVYLGIYPADAGHDYSAILERNFSHVVVADVNGPTMMDRSEFLLARSKR